MRIIRQISILLGVVLVVLPYCIGTVYGAVGINQAINFQGKVVNSDGTNVSDGTYDFVFKIYDGAGSAASTLFTESWTSSALFSSTMSSAPGSAGETLTYSSDTNESTLKVGQILWNTTKGEAVIITSVNTSGTGGTLGISPTRQAWANSDTITNKIYVKDGIFTVAVNSLNQDLSGVDFNTDSIFFGVKFSTDSEMKPRIQFKSTPYAFQAKQVTGLSVASGKTLTASNTLTFTGTDGTSFAFPTGSDTVVGLVASQILTNKTIGSTGLTFSGATTDITTASNEDLAIVPAGTGKVAIGTSTTTSTGYFSVVQASTGKALATFNETGNQAILTASKSGATKFLIDTNGNVGIGTISPVGLLQLFGNVGTNGLANFNQQGTGDIITASAGGTTKVRIDASGNIIFNQASTIQTAAGTGALTLEAQGTGTTSVVQIGAGGSGSTTPDYLALDVKSSTGDPAGGAEGYMYYNTFDNKFRCFQGSAWTDCIGAGGSGPTVQESDGSPSVSSVSTIQFGPASNSSDEFIVTDQTGGTVRVQLGNKVVTTDNSVILTNKTIGSTGLTFSGATTDITTGTNEDFTISPNGNGKVAIGTTTTSNLGAFGVEDTSTGKALATFNEKGDQAIITASKAGATKFVVDNSGNVGIGTSTPSTLVDIEGARTGQAAVQVNESGDQAIFTASASGVSRFTINNDGSISSNTTGAGLIINSSSSTDIYKSTSNNNSIDTDFQRTQNGTPSTLTNLDNNSGDLSLSLGTVVSEGTITTAGQPAVNAAIGAGAFAITRPDGRYLIIRGGATTAMSIYDSIAGTIQASFQTLNNTAGAGALGLPRADGRYRIIHGGGATTTSLVDPMNSAPVGVSVALGTAANTGTTAYKRPDGKYLLSQGGATATAIYDPVADTFTVGPTASTTKGAGSLLLPRPDGTALLIHGGTNIATTQLYDPYNGAGNIGAFSSGPSLPVGCEINGAGSVAIQKPDGRYIILSKANVSVEYDPVNNTMGSCQAVGPTVALADSAHAFRRQDRKIFIVIGSGSTVANIYDPATNTYTAHGTALSSIGAGAFSLIRHDGKVQIFVGGGTTTNNYDMGLVMNGSYTSEDLNTSALNTNSTLSWTIGAENTYANATSSATTNIPEYGVQFRVRTAPTQGGLATATDIPLKNSGDLLRASKGDTWLRVYVTFTRPIPQNIIDERYTWGGNGTVVFIRDFTSATLYDYTVDNSSIYKRSGSDFVNSQLSTSQESSPSALTRIQAFPDRLILPYGDLTQTTQFQVGGANSGFYTGKANSHQPLPFNTGDGTVVIARPDRQFAIIATGSATMALYDPASTTFTLQSGAGNVPSTAPNAGAFGLKLPSGKFLIVIGGGTTTTNIYDPNAASGSRFVVGPVLSGAAGAGAAAIQNADGTYTIIHGGGSTTSSLFNPYTDLNSTITLQGGPTLTTAANCGFWAIPLQGAKTGAYRVFPGAAAFATGITTSMLYDARSKVFSSTSALSSAHGCGSFAFQRQDGYWLSVAGAAGTNGAISTATNLINPFANTTIAGPTFTTGVGRGGTVLPRSDGTFLIIHGQSTVNTNGNNASIYIPWGGTFGVGAGIGTLSTASTTLFPDNAGAGTTAFWRPDGKWVILMGGLNGSNIVDSYDAGWYADGQYLSGQINAPQLNANSSMQWKQTPDKYINFEVRTAGSRESLLTIPYKSVSRSGDDFGATSNTPWMQIQINFSREFPSFGGTWTDVYNSMGGMALPYIQISTPTLFEFKVSSDSDLLNLESGGQRIFRVNSSGNVFTSAQGGFYSGGADLAERYTSKQALEKGEVVTSDPNNPEGVMRATNQYQQTVLGVVSTQPGFVAGAFTQDSYPIALVGRVPVRISTENGPIKVGDYLTSASIPGYAMKATVAGRVIGTALEDLDNSKASDCPQIALGNLASTKCGTIMMFVNLIDYQGQAVELAMADAKAVNPDLLTDNGGIQILDRESGLTEGVSLSSQYSQQMQILTYLRNLKNQQTDQTFNSEIFTGRVSAIKEVISPQIITDLLIAKKIKADSIEGLEILTNKISSLDSIVSTLSGDTNTSTNSSQLTGINITSNATMSGDFHDKGSGLFDGVLTAINGVKTANLSISNLAEFINQAIFKGDVQFIGRPTFNKDTAGLAVITKGADEVEIKFDKEYESAPVVTANITFDEVSDQDTAEQLTHDVLEQNIKYVITKRSKKGFIIKLNTISQYDIPFSWTAIAVKDIKTQQSETTPTPTPANNPSTSWMVVPTNTPTPVASSSATPTP